MPFLDDIYIVFDKSPRFQCVVLATLDKEEAERICFFR